METHAPWAARGADTAPPVRADVVLAGVAVRPFALSALRAGADAVAVDYFGDRDLRRAVRTLSLRRDRGADAYSASGLVELAEDVSAPETAYAADLENHPSLVERLSRGRLLLGNPPEVLRAARDPRRLAKALEEEGLPTPRVRPAGDTPSPTDGPPVWLRKPLRSGGGRGIRPWRPGDTPAEDEYLQEWIRGEPVSVLFLADGAEARVLAATEMLVGRREFGATGFRYCGNLLRRSGEGAPLPPSCWPAGRRPGMADRLARTLTRRFGLTGLNGIDAVLRDDRLWPTEVNPRWTASMELLEVGAETGGSRLPRALFDLHREACAGRLPTPGELPGGGPRPEGTTERVTGKALLRARRDGPAPDLELLEGISLADVPEPGEPIPAGGPVCTLLASAPDREGCLARLEGSAARVRGALAVAR